MDIFSLAPSCSTHLLLFPRSILYNPLIATALFGNDNAHQSNIWRGDQPCVASALTNCTSDEVADLNAYASSIVADYKRTEKWSRPGEGGFVESCIEHVAAQGPAFDKYEINGVTEVDAFINWWKSDGTDPAAQHWSWPCTLNDNPPHQCNPSCNAKKAAGCDPNDIMCH